jgi:hypothetical protein
LSSTTNTRICPETPLPLGRPIVSRRARRVEIAVRNV